MDIPFFCHFSFQSLRLYFFFVLLTNLMLGFHLPVTCEEHHERVCQFLELFLIRSSLFLMSKMLSGSADIESPVSVDCEMTAGWKKERRIWSFHQLTNDYHEGRRYRLWKEIRPYIKSASSISPTLTDAWSPVHTGLDEFKKGFTLKTHQMSSVHTMPEKSKSVTNTGHFRFCVLGKRKIIVAPSFSPRALKRKDGLFNSPGLKSVSEKVGFRDGLVWGVGLTVEVKLRYNTSLHAVVWTGFQSFDPKTLQW